MSAIDLDAIEARADVATPEPWVFYNGMLMLGGMTREQLVAYDSDPDDSAWKDAVDTFEPSRAEDGEFIAHVRADVFDLIDHARQLERQVDALAALANEHWDWKAGRSLADRLREILGIEVPA